MELRKISAARLEVIIRDCLAEAQDRPDMQPFLKQMLGDVLHEMKIEEIARSPATVGMLDFLARGSP